MIDWMEDNDPERIDRARSALVYRAVGRGSGVRPMEQSLRFVGVPHHLVERRIQDFRGTYMDPVARRFLNSSMGPGLVMVGKTGTGKTSFASAMCRSMLNNNLSVRFMTMDEFARFHTGRIDLSKNAAQYDDFAERMDEWHEERWRMEQVYELLVIDEVQGNASVPQFVLDEFATLVRKRVGSEGCTTVMTSNRTLDELTEYLGDRFGAFVRRELECVKMVDRAFELPDAVVGPAKVGHSKVGPG